MPYAQVHYPFENKEQFEKNFPADFITEYLAQTRGWFYTLFVLSTCERIKLWKSCWLSCLQFNPYLTSFILSIYSHSASSCLKIIPIPASINPVFIFHADSLSLSIVASVLGALLFITILPSGQRLGITPFEHHGNTKNMHSHLSMRHISRQFRKNTSSFPYGQCKHHGL